MDELLRVDPDLLRAESPKLSAIADVLQQQLTLLKTRLAQEGECWGNDEPGRIFGDSYEPHATAGIASFENLVDNLHRMSNGLADAADAFHNQDHDNGSYIRNSQWNFGPDLVAPVGPLSEQLGWPGPGLPQSVLSGPQPNPGLDAVSPGRPDAPPQRFEQPEYQPDADSGGSDQQEFADQGPGGGSEMLGFHPSLPTPASAPPMPVQDPAATTPTATYPSKTPRSSKPDERPPLDRKPPNTPWQRKESAISGSPNGSGLPGPRNAPGSVPLRRVLPPQPISPAPGVARRVRRTKPGRDTKTGRPKAVPTQLDHARVETDPAAMEAARALAARHGLQIAGFETCGAAELTVHEIASAVDNILGKYPFLALRGIAITELSDSTVPHVAGGQMDATVAAGWIILDRNVVADPARIAERGHAATQSSSTIPGFDEWPMYSITVHELGSILEAAAGPSARRRAQTSLITEYRRISGPWNRTNTLAHVVAGYRQWRAQLGGRSFSHNRFHPSKALVEAFTEVELRGESARRPAKVLHRLLVETARGRSSNE
jgi:hypothetical protein